MFYKKYLVKDTDHFDPDHFPSLMEDMDTIVMAMDATPAALNAEMLLSFLKSHSIRTEWVKAKPELAEMISSKSLPITGLEALFESCTENPDFRNQLEEHIRVRLSMPTLS
jgi:hypothetical protein